MSWRFPLAEYVVFEHMSSAPVDSVSSQLKRARDAHRSGNLDLAGTYVEDLLTKNPGRPEVLLAGGVIAFAQGSFGVAFDRLSASLKLDPDDAEALAWAARAGMRLSRFQEAEGFARSFARVRPREKQAHFLHANALRGLGRIHEALVAVDRLLAIDPEDIDGLVLKARLLDDYKLPSLAIEFYRRALSLGPAPQAAIQLAQIHFKDGRPRDALELLDRVAPSLPDHVRPYDLMAKAYTLMRDFQKAEALWSLAERHAIDGPDLVRRRARAEMTVGRFEVAEELLLSQISDDAAQVEAFSLLVRCRRMRPEDQPAIERMESLSGSASEPGQGAALHFALGKAYDDLQEYAAAIRHFDEANRIKYEEYCQSFGEFDPERARAYTDFHIGFFTPDLLAERGALGFTSSLPLFVTGMVRSGTTLTESILGAHSLIHPGGEQTFWTDRATEFLRGGTGPVDVDWPLAHQFGREYLTEIDPGNGAIKHVVDKNPANFALAAILHCVYPWAKIVHLKRNALDNVLSIWCTPLGGGPSFTSKRENLVFTYREHLRLLRHFEEILPEDRFKSFKYEELVSDPVSRIGELFAFLGLEPEPGCFEPEKTDRFILTPTLYQARQPINLGSMDRWRHYEPWLGPFGDWINELESL